MSATELHNLAVRFRVGCPNLCHVDTRDAIAGIGGEIAIHYGYYIGIAKRNVHKRYRIATKIADMLERKAT